MTTPPINGHGPQITVRAADENVAVTAFEATQLDLATLTAAGVRTATALALTSEDDQANLHAGLRARQLNPDLRLVLCVYNRRLGRRMDQLLDRAVIARHPELSPAALQASTTALSASATAAPALVAAAVSGPSHVVHVDGRLLRAVDAHPGRHPRHREVATLAATGAPGAAGPAEGLLPDPDRVPACAQRVVLTAPWWTATRSSSPPRPRGSACCRALPAIPPSGCSGSPSKAGCTTAVARGARPDIPNSAAEATAARRGRKDQHRPTPQEARGTLHPLPGSVLDRI